MKPPLTATEQFHKAQCTAIAALMSHQGIPTNAAQAASLMSHHSAAAIKAKALALFGISVDCKVKVNSAPATDPRCPLKNLLKLRLMQSQHG